MTRSNEYQELIEADVTAPLSIDGVSINYKTKKGEVQAVRHVSLALQAGETMALIGESGSGKTTLGLGIVKLLAKTAEVSEGSITYRRNGRGVEVLDLDGDELRQFRWRECAMVFQSALNSFNPVLRVWDQIWDTARAHDWTDKGAVREKALELLKFVQLDASRVINAYPHELSGGMRQRVLIAMSLLLDPQILILDEPTTALDILTQRTIIELLRRLKEEKHFSMIFISHDLAIAAELADRIATVYAGKVVEIGPVKTLFYMPAHAYTLGLIRAVPTVTGGFEELESIPGSPPDLVNLPSGCKFHPRCSFATEICEEQEPELVRIGPNHFAACWHWQEVKEQTKHRNHAYLQENGRGNTD